MGQHQILTDKLQINHAASRMLHFSIIYPMMFPQFLPHLHYFSLELLQISRSPQYFRPDRLKALGWTPEATAARLGERSDRLLIFRPSQPPQNDTPTLPDAVKN